MDTSRRGQLGNFKHGMSRAQEMRVKRELEDIKKTSVKELAHFRAEMLKDWMSTTQQNELEDMANMPDEFGRSRLKREPHFDDDYLNENKVLKNVTRQSPVPQYNPLDKTSKTLSLGASKRRPFNREDIVTVEEMRMPHKTALGVVPVRHSTDIDGLNVVMEGKPAINRDDVTIAAVEEANKETSKLRKPRKPVKVTQVRADLVLDGKPPTTDKPPVIVGAAGTVMAPPMANRPKPPAHPMSENRATPRSITKKSLGSSRPPTKASKQSKVSKLSRSTAYSARTAYSKKRRDSSSSESSDSEEYSSDEGRRKTHSRVSFVGDETSGGQRRRRRAASSKPSTSSSRQSSARSVSSVKSASELLAEAEAIASPEGLRRRPEEVVASIEQQRAESVRQATAIQVEVPKERSVDDIISSLKASRGGVKEKSEADLKIQAIMEQVMKRAKSVLGDDAAATEEAKEEQGEEGGSQREDFAGERIVEGEERPESEDREEEKGQLDPKITIILEALEEEVGEERRMSRDQQGGLGPLSDDPSRTASSLSQKGDLVDAASLTQRRESLREGEAPTTKMAVSFGNIEEEHEEAGSRVTVDLEQAWKNLNMPQEVSYEDVVHVLGESGPVHSRQDLKTVKADLSSKRAALNVYSTSVSFLSAWAPQEKESKQKEEEEQESVQPLPSIHHFCTNLPRVPLPGHLQSITRTHHTPSKYSETRPLPFNEDKVDSLSPLMNKSEDETRDPDHQDAKSPSTTQSKEWDRKISVTAQKIIDQALNEEKESSLDDWQKRAEEMLDEETQLEIEGKTMPVKTGISRLYWMPAPPKMDVPPVYIKSHLFSKYHGLAMDESGRNPIMASSGESEDDYDVSSDEEDIMGKHLKERIMSRKYHSSEDLTNLSRKRKVVKKEGESQQEEEEGEEEETTEEKTETDIQSTTAESEELAPRERRPSYLEMKFKFPLIKPMETTHREDEMEDKKEQQVDGTPKEEEKPVEKEREDVFLMDLPLRRTRSMVELAYEDTLVLQVDFSTYMEELKTQKQQIEDIRLEKSRAMSEMEDATKIMDSEEEEVIEAADEENLEQEVKKLSKASKPTPAEISRLGGLKYIPVYKKRGSKLKKGPVDTERLEKIERFLRDKPMKLTRTTSLPRIKFPPDPLYAVDDSLRHQRRPSIPKELDFKSFLETKNYQNQKELREWVRDLWNFWFEEVFPENSESEYSYEPSHSPTSDAAPTTLSPTKRKLSLDSSISVAIDDIGPVNNAEENEDLIMEMRKEVHRLTERIGKSGDHPSAFDFCRRGAMYRKLGVLNRSMEDLDRAIEIEPQLLDAYWHRHLLHLLHKRPHKALDDLNYILRVNKQNAVAYRARAEIFRQLEDATMAIVNFTQTIKLAPDDYDAYYQRAEMYEKKGEMLLALEDYKIATRLMPSKTEAIFKHGYYQFNNGNWQSTIKDFSEMLLQEPENALARTYRGRAFAKLGMYANAVEDLSAAIHLDPNSSVAFYHRGCLLRKVQPQKALQDLSVSLLLDDSANNVMAFLHRGILYMDIDKYQDAISDFEDVISLDKEIACAHVNLGLIYMTRLENHSRAILYFTNAVKVDPTYWRAFICRAEAYRKKHDQANALLDYTRAIHLRPDLQHLYMYRGRHLLDMKNLELASFCVRHAAELSQGLGSSPTQQAAVHSFLHNYPRAIDILSAASRVKPTVPNFVLLGKTQMKAKKFKSAVENLNNALELMKPWQAKHTWPREAAEVFYLLGLCQTEVPNHLQAFEAFNNAIKIKPDYSDAHYQRGLTRMRLRQFKGIQDFNRALALNPKLFQAYLSRAAYYGMKGRFSKGILNCNEAIKLQPKSVRGYLYRGALKFYIKSFSLAILDLTEAIVIDNKCALAYFNRAVCYHTIKDYQQAHRDYGIVLLVSEQRSLTLKVLINRGLMYFERNEYKCALQDFIQAVKVEPNDPKIRHTLGLCYHKLMRLEEAVKAYSGALQVDQFFLDAYIGRGNAFMDYGHTIATIAARHDYERTLVLDPLCLSARVNLGYNLQISGKFKQAWDQFTACLSINPRYRPALEGRAVVCLQMADFYAAFQDMNSAINVGPTAELYTNRGVVNQFMKNLHNAASDYQAAIKLDPAYGLAYFNAANLYFQTRQFGQAKDYYDKAIEFSPRNESALLNRAITKVLLRDAQGAMADFKRAISLSPYSAHIYFNRGNLYTSLKLYSKAEKDYSKALELKPDDPLVHKRRGDILGKLNRKDDAILDYRRAVDIQTKRQRIVKAQ